MDKNFSCSCREVFHITNLNLTTLIGLQDTVDEGAWLRSSTCSLTIRYLRNSQCLAISLLNLCTNSYRATSLSIIILRNIYAASRRKVRIEMKFFTMKITDSSITNLNKIVWQNLTIQAHSNTFSTLRKQQRKLDRQRNRLFVPAIIAPLPLRSLRVEDHIEGKLGETRLYVTPSGSIITSNDVPPVALTVNQQVLLSKLHKRVLDAGIAMRMELHRMSNYIGYLVVLAIIHPLHRVHDASLNRLETISNVRHSTLQDYIGSIIKEPVLIHLVQMVSNTVCWSQIIYH